tara:strand:+ start:7696 stop:7971 length:276 start_codon:yes stop_codon:yes gene_type:complete
MKLNKLKISKIISRELDISTTDSKIILDAFIETIKSELSKKTVKINGFGSFVKKRSPKRVGRNPKTKESYIIEPRSKISLIISNKVRESLN